MAHISGQRFPTVLALSFAAALACGMTRAQESAEETAAKPEAIEEVVVTAQRRVQNLQDVPISALVLSGEMLESKGVEGLYSLQYAAPSLTVAGYGSANVLNIRGIGRSAVDIELPSGVVIYRDGFPTFPGYFQNERYFDIASIEILRGPQGTFVGKSAAGGAIFIRTAAPDLSGFGGMVEGEVGNFRHFGGTLVVNAPLTDEFGVRLAYQHVQRDEILVDSLSGPYTGRPGRPELDSLRLGALWNPTGRLTAQARLDLSDLDFGGNLTSSYGSPLYDLVQDVDYRYLDRSVRAVGDIKYEFGEGLVLSSVTGYQRAHTWNNFDRNGNEIPVNRFESEGVFELYSQEFNLISPDDVGPFSYVAGLFFQRTDSVIFDWRRKGFNVVGAPGDLGGLVQGSEFPYLGLDTPYTKREDELSAFVDFKYALTETLEAELGIRYSNYKLANDTNIVIGDGISPPTIPFFAGQQDLDEDDVDAKLSLTWSLSDQHNLYGLVARGHVNGGFNIIGGAFFEKQIIYDYEAGLKSTLAGGRVRTQLGAYYQTFSNYQAQFASEDLPGQNLLQNADGKSTVYGFEASLQARLGNFSLDTALALLKSELGTFPRVVSPFLPAPDNIISISGGKTPFAPEFSLNVGASYRFDIGADFGLTPRLDLARVTEQSGSLIVAPNTRLAARTLLNGGLRLDKDSWYVDIAVTNITDERYVAGIQDLGNVWYPGDPRMYQLKVGTTF
jgi:iron complex outermembrane receptor protein